MLYVRPTAVVKFIVKIIIYFDLKGIREDISTQSVEIFSVPAEHFPALTTETFGVDDSVPKLASKCIVTVAGKLYVGRGFNSVTGRSAFGTLASVFISTIFLTVRIPIANQRFADALT